MGIVKYIHHAPYRNLFTNTHTYTNKLVICVNECHIWKFPSGNSNMFPVYWVFPLPFLNKMFLNALFSIPFQAHKPLYAFTWVHILKISILIVFPRISFLLNNILFFLNSVFSCVYVKVFFFLIGRKYNGIDITKTVMCLWLSDDTFSYGSNEESLSLCNILIAIKVNVLAFYEKIIIKHFFFLPFIVFA